MSGTDVAEVWHHEVGWKKARWMILIRHEKAKKKGAGDKKSIDCPGYRFQALDANQPDIVVPIAVWRGYNQRADCEEVIKGLNADFGLPQLCEQKFWVAEAALWLAVLSYNLYQLFQRHMGWLERVTAVTLRFQLFTTGGIISRRWLDDDSIERA